MDTNFAIYLSFCAILIIMLMATWLIEDKPGAKPARLAFRVFYLSYLMLFFMLMNKTQPDNPLMIIAIDLGIAISTGSLLLGVLWRCQSPMTNSVVYFLCLGFIVIDTILLFDGKTVSYVFVVTASLVGSYALFKRSPHSNAGDKGMAVVMLLWVGVFLFKISGELGFDLAGFYNQQVKDSLTFIVSPAYVSGITLFLISSYMLDAQHDLAQQADTDPMTGLYNRRYFIGQAKKLLRSARRYEQPISVIMCDIDKFKSINDKHGHDIGDAVIKAFANCLSNMLRNDDILARYGGEEFVIILPQANDLAVMLVAERMREEAEALAIRIPNGQLRFTVSFGVCQVTDFSDIEISISEADTAMYQAKNSGRNRVCLYENRED